ncbi:hypothetical protein MTBSS4_210113 [Magnetospirillum sp. SS-4]|nr:hypothetical protein MTBSS4_210113 [Magnetospirillum sp. SS-4]
MGRIWPASSNQGQQIQAENGAEPWAFAQGSLRQRIYSLEVMAEGRGLVVNLLSWEINEFGCRATS